MGGVSYQRGAAWLLEHQEQDGSFQPMFDPGFPHGDDQFISAAGTNWAVQTLEMALPEKNTAAGVRGVSLGLDELLSGYCEGGVFGGAGPGEAEV